ncbi:digalactosyldiacylglycerol synthase 2, chloroplastic-like [Magnolia sinica]|uniref:digalactosyldiacylglycerol synthase 2, chloroplastic-like n=1 Tax=Magnolia sinica TaxID=86752 RepID=UPI002658CE25|nr:digalactosyldiacylglycerol synthase 2, chloroplastic-like [Magnolia sinica]XP_058107427.1 digalactosyldiacylglycerol synthase 2, chloroplastic-like [Magnolia sinica]XP_058107428.1 digalactosyldiacylglycerol synthase 2, chloroplastic-like [Magnolia sinica]
MDEKQHIAIFTTASLPWMTGTAVNPLFRAAYLAKDGERNITLVIPWLSLKDQGLVYPNRITFSSPSEQETYVRCWLEERTGFISGFKICFYPGKFAKDKGSILAVGDITEVIPNEEADIAVLEEPEHLTWFHHGQRWKKKFRHVIGVVHTNYLEYVKREKNGRLNAFFLKRINSWVVNIFCHKVIRLSAATQDLPRSIICNVHGVNPKFIQIGKRKQEQQQNGDHAFTKGAYYIGKMVWSKGYRELLQLLSAHQNQLSDLQVDLYGDGGDSDQVQEAARKLKLAVKVYPGRDHADPLFYEYKVFLNPSTTDVVCTTTAEALAMGKIAVCANHPSNDFFKQFPNCRMYNRGDEFVKATRAALADEPAPLTDDQRHELSWEAATERFVQAAELDQAFKERPTSAVTSRFAALSLRMADLKRKMEDVSAFVHYTASGIEAARRAFGAVPGSLRPDEEQCKELGLVYSQEKHGSNRWLSRSS